MGELDKLLGFESDASFLVAKFLNDAARRLVIRGPSGSGKTSLAKSVSDRVVDAGCTVVWLRGDAGRVEEQCYPLSSALKPGGIGRFLGVSTQIVGGLAEDFLPAGKATAKVLLSLLPRGESDVARARMKDAANSSEEFLSMVARLLKRHRVLLVADDVQYFDIRSLELLRRLLETRGDQNDVGRVSILATINTDAPLREEITALIGMFTATANAIELSYCSKQEFSSVLAALGLRRKIPRSLSDLLYDCSGGHLHIANFIVDELNTFSSPEIQSAAYSDLLHYIIRRRIGDAPLESDVITKLLCSAAHIGRSFSRDELSCLSELNSVTLRQCLELAEALGFIERDDQLFRFSHEIIRTYFLKESLKNKILYSAKYSDCLRILRPYDYFARCVSLTAAQDLEAAAVAYCQGIIAQWRSGRTDDGLVDADLRHLIKISADQQDYLTAIHDAYELLSEGDFRATQLRLAELQSGLSEILLAERDYVLAEAQLKHLGTSKSEEARSILCEWDYLQDKEPELWCRMRLLLLLARVQLCRFDEARKTEREIIAFLSRRTSFDRGAEKQINRLLALSEMHSAGEIARKRIVQACNFYEKRLNEQGYTDLYEYFICLTNRSGNAITIGNFPDAIQQGLRALTLNRDYPSLRLPARWAAANNAIVASYLDRRLNAKDAAGCLHDLSSRFPNLDDDLLLHSNIGSLKLLANEPNASLIAFDHTQERLKSTPDIDSYYRYLPESNRAIAIHLAGGTHAREIWDACESLIPGIAPAMRADLRERHITVTRLFNDRTFGSFDQWNSQFEELTEANARYRRDRFPKGIFLSDIQIWSSL